MAIRKVGDAAKDETTLLRVTIPKTLLKEIRATKKLCKDHGFVFDIKPDVEAALQKAIAEARRTVSGSKET